MRLGILPCRIGFEPVRFESRLCLPDWERRTWGTGVESRSSAVTEVPFLLPAHRTGRADFPHPALGQELTPSPTESFEGERTNG